MQKDVIFYEEKSSLVAVIQSDVDHHTARPIREKIDAKLFEKYAQKREGKHFPVFVALAANKCGGCRMEISASKLSSMKTNQYGVIECENCGRYIYQK